METERDEALKKAKADDGWFLTEDGKEKGAEDNHNMALKLEKLEKQLAEQKAEYEERMDKAV